MKTLNTRKILGCLLVTAYITFVVAGAALGCCCSTAPNKVASRAATHDCAHNSSRLIPVPQQHGDVCDGISAVRSCCHCTPLSTGSSHPHLANGPENAFQFNTLAAIQLPPSARLVTGAIPRSEALSNPPNLKSRLTNLRSVFLLI
jgi:hypothetical protein